MQDNALHPTIGVYIKVFVVLLILLVATVVVAEVDMGQANFPIAAAIATLKAALIMLFFMHVRYSPPLTRLVSCAGFAWLTILLVLTLSDYFTRDAMPPN